MKLRNSVAYRVIQKVFIIVALITVILGFFLYFTERNRQQSVLREKSKFLTQKISYTISISLWNFDIESIDQLISFELQDKDILGIIIFDESDNIINGKIKNENWESIDYDPAHEKRYTHDRIFIDIKEKIIRDEQTIGYLKLIITDYFLKHTLEEIIFQQVIQLSIFTIVLLAIVLVSLYFIIFKPLGRISQHTLLVAEGDLSFFDQYLNQDDELGQLVKSFNKMIDNFINISEKLRVISNVLKTTAAKNIDVTHRFTDITNNEASAIEQISSAILQSSSSMKNISDNTEISATKLSQGAIKANEGFRLIDDIISAIEEISKRSTNIKNSLDFINDLTEETDMLALNASIEAAKAGDYGKGFAVVANEIRKLAERSQDTAKTIDKRIKENDDIVEKARHIIINSQEIIKDVLETTVDSDHLLAEISLAVNEQAKGQEEMTKSVNNINQSMQKIVDSADHIKVSAKKIEESSDSLINIVNIFKINKSILQDKN